MLHRLLTSGLGPRFGSRVSQAWAGPCSEIAQTQDVIDPSSLRRRPTHVDRSGDRWVAVGAIVIAVSFLVAALVSFLLPVELRRGGWLPLHLALAGGAASAIAGVMPFFSAAFAAAPPSDTRLRWSALLAVALGAVGVAIGVSVPVSGLAVVGGAVFIGGIVLTGIVTVRPLRSALGASRGLVTEAYVVALAEVATGAILATLLLAGWPPVAEVWVRLKPAHAWLNLVGFVSLVIATTLLHFFPTVIGARIASHRSARVAVVGLAAGAPLVALGYAASSDLLARFGALGTLAGAAGVAVYAWRVWPTRGRWTTDRDWHRFAMLGLISALAWFEVGIAIAAGRVFVFGSAPEAWSIEAVVAPLVAGWVGSAVLASATHLLPAIGPGDPVVHGRQRALLGRLAVARLVSLDLGVVAMSLGIPLGAQMVVLSGALLTGAALVATAVLLVRAVTLGMHGRISRVTDELDRDHADR
jgi:nitrite reductase (NO-forming)